MKKWIWVLVIALLVWNSWLTIQFLRLESHTDTIGNDTQTSTIINDNIVTDFTTDLTEVVDNVRSSVVRVSAEGENAKSGIIYAVEDNTTYILTSYLTQTKNLQVIFDSGARNAAELIGSDQTTGISLISVNTSFSVTPMRVGDSRLIEQGEYVIALGARNSSTAMAPISFGVVSESGQRRISSSHIWLAEVLETDTSIHEGFYGGPLLNVGGEMIGILVPTPVNASVNMGYALGSTEVKLIFNELKNGGVSRASFGVVVRNVDSLRAYEKSELNIALDVREGVVVTDKMIKEGEISSGDVIVSVAGKSITDIYRFREVLYELNEGETVKVEVLRNGNREEVEVTLR